jgi:hypothetical protein
VRDASQKRHGQWYGVKHISDSTHAQRQTMLHANGTAVDVQIQRDASSHESIYAFAVCVCSFARASNGGHNTQARDVRWGDWSGFGIACNCKHARGDGTSRRNPNEISHDLSPPWHPRRPCRALPAHSTAACEMRHRNVTDNGTVSNISRTAHTRSDRQCSMQTGQL